MSSAVNPKYAAFVQSSHWMTLGRISKILVPHKPPQRRHCGPDPDAGILFAGFPVNKRRGTGLRSIEGWSQDIADIDVVMNCEFPCHNSMLVLVCLFVTIHMLGRTVFE